MKFRFYILILLFLYPSVCFSYHVYNSCKGSYSGCYDGIVDGCNKLYPSSDLNAQTQYNRMGCISDSMRTIMPGWENRLVSNYVMRKAYFSASINNEMPFYKALELSNNAADNYNASINNYNSNNTARQRCLSNCLLNNSAGSGFSGALGGLAACNQQCP